MPNNANLDRKPSSTCHMHYDTFFLSVGALRFYMLVAPFLTLAVALLHFVVIALSRRPGFACLVLRMDRNRYDFSLNSCSLYAKWKPDSFVS